MLVLGRTFGMRESCNLDFYGNGKDRSMTAGVDSHPAVHARQHGDWA